jgi:hypothetical protein
LENFSDALENLSSDAKEKHRKWLEIVAGPQRSWGDSRDNWLERAADEAGISFRKARAIFYGEIIDAEHPDIRKLKEVATQRATAAFTSELARKTAAPRGRSSRP